MLKPLPIYNAETAPEISKEILKRTKEAIGFVPNLLGVMSGAPAVLKGYKTLSDIFDSTSLTPTERQVILLSTSYANGCKYCVAAHTAIAGMQKVDSEVIQAIRSGTPIANDKLEALRNFTIDTVRSLGYPSISTKEKLITVGYSETTMMEVILGIGLKTISNYINHLAEIPLDNEFATVAWDNG